MDLPSTARTADDLRVLVVDDNPADQALYRRYLAAQPDSRYTLVPASYAEQAADLLDTQHFDCILLDYQLPRTSGLDFLRHLKSSIATSGIPVIMLTGQGSEEVAVECMRRGAADYIPKSKLSAASCRRAIGNAIEKATLKRTIQDQTQRLKEANAVLQMRNNEISNFYHSVSHEIKTPLTAIREFIALVHDGIVGETTEQQREILSHAIESCDDLSFLFNDLIDCARLETGKLTLRKKPESVSRVLKRSVIAAYPAVEAKGIVLVEKLDDLPPVPMDATRIVQVVANLLNNAIKYTEPGGEITVFARLAGTGETVEIGVTDTGCGIDQAHLGLIFDRLYQVKAVGDELMGAGLGLGLSIAKEIVRLHDGTIEVESTCGVGSTFTVRLPIIETAIETMKKDNAA